MTIHPAPRITLTWVNPYFQYGPLCGGMIYRGKLCMKMMYKIFSWYHNGLYGIACYRQIYRIM